MKRRQVTIKDIAAELGISKSTVSRALGGAEDISKATRERVLYAAESMDYHPNVSALNLIAGKTKTIGVIIPAFTIPFYSRVISALQNEALKSGYNIMVCQSNEDHRQEQKNLDLLVRSGVDGIALSLARDTSRTDHLEKLKARGIPVVLFNRVVENMPISTVTVDDFGGAKRAVEYLISRGRSRIGYIGGPEGILLAQKRRSGYLQALKDAGIEVDERIICDSGFTLEDGKKCTSRILMVQPGIDALFCVCDQVAYGAMERLKEAGIGIPGEIAVVGFTNEAVSALTSPSLTTVSQPMEEIGISVARILLDHIGHYTASYPPVHQVFEPELVVRGSG